MSCNGTIGRDARAMRRRLVARRMAAAFLVAGFCLPAAAAEKIYTVVLHDRQRVAFQLEIPVAHSGVLAVAGEWEPSRVLTFKLEGPGSPPRTFRRTGPSPLRMEIQVDPESEHMAEVWMLNILGLPSRGAGNGTLRVELPDPPGTGDDEPEAFEPPPEPEPEPWMVPVKVPEELRADRVRFHEAVERYRRLVVLPGWETAKDSCGWQTAFLQYAGDWRDRTSTGADLPAISTVRYLRSLVEMVGRIEQLRSSDDPVLTGPMPSSPEQKRAWLRSRRGRILPLERDIDHLLDNLRDGFAPELEPEDWPQRFISCLMACERHFEETARVGGEEASNREIATTQWPAIRAASHVMESLTSLSAVVPASGENR